MVSVPVSPYCELARWTLDRLGVDYVEQCHAPVFNTLAARRHRGGAVVPILDIGGTSLTDARQIVRFYDQRAPDELKLFPADPGQRAEVKQLFDEFFDELGVAVRAWAYAYQLSERASTTRAWLYRAPRLERWIVPVVYPLIAARLRKGLGLHAGSAREQRAIVDASFARLEDRVGDGRRYLVGERLSAADLALVTLIAPAVLPPEYRGPLPAMDELAAPMRREVEQLRDHPVGRFALRLYAEERAGPLT